jgi:hypothetical protein
MKLADLKEAIELDGKRRFLLANIAQADAGRIAVQVLAEFGSLTINDSVLVEAIKVDVHLVLKRRLEAIDRRLTELGVQLQGETP